MNTNIINTSAELTSTTVRIQMLRDEITSDIKNGKEFQSLVPVSARTYFGSKWLDKVMGRMDSMEIFKHSEKDRLIPYDLILSGMAEAKEEYHSSSHEDRNNVMLYVSGKSFEGKVSVLAADDKKAVLGMVWQGSSFSGTFVNAQDIEPVEKEISTLQQRLTQIMQQLTMVEQVAEDVPAGTAEKVEDKPVIEPVIPNPTVATIRSIRPVASQSRLVGYAMLSIGICLTLYSVI